MAATEHSVVRSAIRSPDGSRRRWPFVVAGIAILLLALFVGGAVVVSNQAESLVRERLAQMARRAGFELTLGRVDLRLFSGRASLHRVHVSDPQFKRKVGYAHSINVRFRVVSWLRPQVQVSSLLISDVVLRVPRSRSTIKAYLRRFRKLATPPPRTEKGREATGRRRLKLDNVAVEFDNVQVRRGTETLASFGGRVDGLFRKGAAIAARLVGFAYSRTPHRFSLEATYDRRTRDHRGTVSFPDRFGVMLRGRGATVGHVSWAGTREVTFKDVSVPETPQGSLKCARVRLQGRLFLGGRRPRLQVKRLVLDTLVASVVLPKRRSLRHAVLVFMGTIPSDDPDPDVQLRRPRRPTRKLSQLLDLRDVSIRLVNGKVHVFRAGGRVPRFVLSRTRAVLTRVSGPKWRYQLSTALTSGANPTAVVQVYGKLDVAKRTLDGDVRLDEFVVPQRLRARTGPLKIVGTPKVDLFGKIRLRQRPLYVNFDGQLQVKGLTVASKLVADEPIVFQPLVAKGQITIDKSRETIELKATKINFGDLKANAHIKLKFDDVKPVLRVRLQFPEQDCHKAIHSIPGALIPMLAQSRFKGVGSVEIESRIDWNALRSVRKTWLSMFADVEKCRAITLGPDLKLQRLRSRFFVHTVAFEEKLIKVGPGTNQWFPLSKMPHFLPLAAMGTEDTAFKIHPGVNVNLIRRAIILNLERRRYVYGGSTISQQLVKNLFLYRQKTLARKLSELIITWQMERTISKDRILELYLNCIEFGPGIYGIKHAAKEYFGKRVDQLNPLETAFLMGLKPSPKAGWYQFRRGQVNWRWQRRLKNIMYRLKSMGAVTAEELKTYEPFKLRFDRTDFSRLSPEKKDAVARDKPQDPVTVKLPGPKDPKRNNSKTSKADPPTKKAPL